MGKPAAGNIFLYGSASDEMSSSPNDVSHDEVAFIWRLLCIVMVDLLITLFLLNVYPRWYFEANEGALLKGIEVSPVSNWLRVYEGTSQLQMLIVEPVILFWRETVLITIGYNLGQPSNGQEGAPLMHGLM